MTVINLPIDDSAIELASDGDERIRWKRILPMNGTIVYGGKKLKFTKELMERLKANYDSKIVDQTAFQLATDSNQHDTLDDVTHRRNFDPQRYRGDVQELKIVENGDEAKDGFWAKIQLTEDGLNLIKNNPNLGISPSIKPDYIDGDGKAHDFVLRHVVGTLDPKVKKMGGWQSGEILLTSDNNKDEEVFGLTSTEPNVTDDSKVSVDKAELDQMKQRLSALDQGPALLDQILAENDEPVSLSNEGNGGNQPPKPDPEVTALKNRVAAADWRAEREQFINAGVPTAMLNLCNDVMSVYESPVINLSDGSSADPRETIRELLKQAKGTVDLSSEEGHGATPDEREAEAKAAQDFINGFAGAYSIDLF